MNCKSLYQNITRNIVIIWISNAERSIGGWLVQNVKELIIFIPYEWTTYTFCITATVGFHNFCFWTLLFRKLGKLTCPLISICYSVTTFWEFQHCLMNMLLLKNTGKCLWFKVELFPLLTMANTEKKLMVSFMMFSWDLMLPVSVQRQMYLNSHVAFQELVQNLV